jgi:triosephosphate isomerase
MVNRKMRAAIQAGLKPIFCIGETLEQRHPGQPSRSLKNR